MMTLLPSALCLLISMASVAQTEVFDSENPITPYAVKENGKARKRFKVPYKVLVEYFDYVSQGAIKPNKELEKVQDLKMNLLQDVVPNDLQFFVDYKNKRSYPMRLLNPDSVAKLFVVDPRAYARSMEAPDFLEAKRKSYSSEKFDPKKMQFKNDYIHLEDWRSLNHPPVDNLGLNLQVWDKDYVRMDYAKVESTFYSEDFQKNLDEISDSELTFGNKVKLLANGESYRRKIQEIKKAKKTVYIAVMSFFCDDSSRELEEVLKAKVEEGVDVRLMVEKVWTKLIMRSCTNRMVKAGVKVVYADDLLKKKENSALFHNKFMIIDNRVLIMGGSNIIESDNLSTGFNHMNRDNDVIAEGPIVTDAMLGYVLLWKQFRGPDISAYENLAQVQKTNEENRGERGQNNYAQVLSHPVKRNEGVCRFVAQNPDTDRYRVTKVYMEYIKNARERMNMTTGLLYFDHPDHSNKERARETYNKKPFRTIFEATERGVKLDLVANGIDGGSGEFSNMLNHARLKNRFKFNPYKSIYSIAARIMDRATARQNQPYHEYIQATPNARAWASYQYMHSKVMQIDRLVSIVSSYNLEEWSGDRSHETAMVCLDRGLARELDESFLRDFVNSVPVIILKNKTKDNQEEEAASAPAPSSQRR